MSRIPNTAKNHQLVKKIISPFCLFKGEELTRVLERRETGTHVSAIFHVIHGNQRSG
jgi:hypothetical protein